MFLPRLLPLRYSLMNESLFILPSPSLPSDKFSHWLLCLTRCSYDIRLWLSQTFIPTGCCWVSLASGILSTPCSHKSQEHFLMRSLWVPSVFTSREWTMKDSLWIPTLMSIKFDEIAILSKFEQYQDWIQKTCNVRMSRKVIWWYLTKEAQK